MLTDKQFAAIVAQVHPPNEPAGVEHIKLIAQAAYRLGRDYGFEIGYENGYQDGSEAPRKPLGY